MKLQLSISICCAGSPRFSGKQCALTANLTTYNYKYLNVVLAQQVFQFQLFGHYRLLKEQQHDLMSVTTLEYVSIIHQGQSSYMHM